MNLRGRFSLAHPDATEQNTYFHDALRNAAPEFRSELNDIFFGKVFRYRHRGREIVYGNVMGVEASDAQVDDLFRIQDELGIEISLTINQLSVPPELFLADSSRVLDAFLAWLKTFYDRGLRSCTMSNAHIMACGALQAMFPKMKWKNTVNQQVANAQQVLDWLALGYHVIQLDRSLNRNVPELKRIRSAVDQYRQAHPDRDVKTCMLVYEWCLPYCPYKREHDDAQFLLARKGADKKPFSVFRTASCSNWRSSEYRQLPRAANDAYWAQTATFAEYARLVDVFKFSGRLVNHTEMLRAQSATPTQLTACWGMRRDRWCEPDRRFDRVPFAASFQEIITNKLEPLFWWEPLLLQQAPDTELPRNWDATPHDATWASRAGRRLERKLMHCANQCYSCHLCERTFGFPPVDSLMALQAKPANDSGRKR